MGFRKLSSCDCLEVLESWCSEGAWKLHPSPHILSVHLFHYLFLSCFVYCRCSVAKSCPTLCDPVDGRPPDSSPWDFPGKNTSVGCHFLLRGSSQPTDRTHISYISRQIIYHCATWEAFVSFIINC